MASSYFTFRFDYEGCTKTEQLLNFIKANCSKYVLFDEIAHKTNKPHYQGKIMPVKSIETFRRNLLKAFPNTFCKSNYSIAPVKKDTYDIYISKDGKVVINNVWTETEISELRQKYVAPDEYKVSNKTERKVPQTWSQRIAQELETEERSAIETYIELIDYETLDYEQYSDYKFKQFKAAKLIILEFTLDRLGKSVKPLSSNIIKQLFYGIVNHFVMKSGKKKEWVLKIYNKLETF